MGRGMQQATVLRILILGLPIGLILTGAFSLVWHYRKPEKPAAPPIFRNLAAEIEAEELESYVRNLADVIGPRHISEPKTLNRAANYVESTLGPRNVGYEVARREYAIDGQVVRNLWLEIPGGKRRNEYVVITAAYDAAAGTSGHNVNASAVAALMGLAENFRLERPKRTIVLAFLTNSTAPHAGTPDSGAAHFASFLESRGDQIQAVLTLEGLGAFPDNATFKDHALANYLPDKGPYLTLLCAEPIPLLNQATEVLSSALSFTVHQGTLLEAASGEAWTTRDAAPFQKADFPTLLVAGNGRFDAVPPQIDGARLTEVTRALATLIRVLANPA